MKEWRIQSGCRPSCPERDELGKDLFVEVDALRNRMRSKGDRLSGWKIERRFKIWSNRTIKKLHGMESTSSKESGPFM